MSGPTTIEWTERTWNPLTGCDRVSPGCDHCSALSLAKRWKATGSQRYQNDGHPLSSGPGFGLTLHWDLVDQPRSWRRPSVVFVNSMSDLFHDRVPVEFIQAVFRTMAETPRHTYHVLTKRSTRLLRLAPELPWPPSLWMGVSVENQDYVTRGSPGEGAGRGPLPERRANAGAGGPDTGAGRAALGDRWWRERP